jgi:hypothetical protein
MLMALRSGCVHDLGLELYKIAKEDINDPGRTGMIPMSSLREIMLTKLLGIRAKILYGKVDGRRVG